MARAKKTQMAGKAGEAGGYTLIEVMLVLGLTGLLLVGVLGGTFASVAAQRYNDSVRSFAEFLRRAYSEAISPESLGQGNSDKYAVLGKALVFGADANDDTIYTATIVGGVKPPTVDGGFTQELKENHATIYCGQQMQSSFERRPSSLGWYTPVWEAEIMHSNDNHFANRSVTSDQKFTGTVIIAKSPSSGAINTIFLDKTYNLRDECKEENTTAASQFETDIQTISTSTAFFTDIGFCIKSDNAKRMREVRLTENGRNTSAVAILSMDESNDPSSNIYGEKGTCEKP